MLAPNTIDVLVSQVAIQVLLRRVRLLDLIVAQNALIELLGHHLFTITRCLLPTHLSQLLSAHVGAVIRVTATLLILLIVRLCEAWVVVGSLGGAAPPTTAIPLVFLLLGVVEPASLGQIS